MDDAERAEAKAIEQKVQALIAEFRADPAKGLAAGYRPNRTRFESREINSPEPVRYETTPSDWAAAILERDFPAWRARVTPVLGGTFVRVLGRR